MSDHAPFRVEKTFTFEASHQLPHHKGKCARLHGHSWTCTVVVEAHELQRGGSSGGMVMDYGDISAAMKPIVEESLDHHHLNSTTGLENPTSEELCRWIYNKLKDNGFLAAEVSVKETCTSRAVYRP